MALFKSNYSTLSLFSGGGLLDLGFLNQGFEIVEAVENHEAFVDCYNEGIKSYVKSSQKEVFKGFKSNLKDIAKFLMQLIVRFKTI